MLREIFPLSRKSRVCFRIAIDDGLIAISDVLDRLVGIAHSSDHLFALGRYDTCVVNTRRDQKGRSDSVNVKQGSVISETLLLSPDHQFGI